MGKTTEVEYPSNYGKIGMVLSLEIYLWQVHELWWGIIYRNHIALSPNVGFARTFPRNWSESHSNGRLTHTHTCVLMFLIYSPPPKGDTCTSSRILKESGGKQKTQKWMSQPNSWFHELVGGCCCFFFTHPKEYAHHLNQSSHLSMVDKQDLIVQRKWDVFQINSWTSFHLEGWKSGFLCI